MTPELPRKSERSHRHDSPERGMLLGLSAAALFGVSTPLSKLLLSTTAPLMLAALLYLGAGVALTAVRAISGDSREARVARGDLPWLAAIIVAGGMVGPILLLIGLVRLSGIAGSLLLNLEMPFTILLATLFFGEHLGRRAVASAVLIGIGALLLGYTPGHVRADWIGIAAVVGACLSWALDNNLTQRLSLRDPIVVTQAKTLGAGVCSLLIAVVAGARWPGSTGLLGGLAIGAVSYGLSLVLNTRALRALGAARQGALFATAPFVGAALSIPLLSERLKPEMIGAALLMLGGVVLLVRERHTHVHTHEPIVHDHLHVHDEHHRHHHDRENVDEPHSHEHRHDPLTHDHPHASDVHHRHRH